MTARTAPVLFATLPERRSVATNVTRVGTALLAVASTMALGSAGVDVAVLAIAVLVPIVLLGSLALTRE